jgi:hypothetical protein
MDGGEMKLPLDFAILPARTPSFNASSRKRCGDGTNPLTKYVLTVSGQIMGDDSAIAIYLENPAIDRLSCRSVALPAPEAGTGQALGFGFSAWNPFSFATTVVPDTPAYLYVLVYNKESSNGNATGLRVEFTSAYLTPE